MLVKTKTKVGEQSNVRFINGFVSLGPVTLNVFCFEMDGVLIDTGAKSILHAFKPFFEEMDVDQVMITHNHEDHTGAAAYLQKHYHLPVFMNELSIPEGKEKASYPLYRKIFWGVRDPFQAVPIANTFDSRHATWDVIATPGHKEDHLSFLNRETGQLFSGDLYVHPRTKVILRNESIPTIINSLRKMITYDFGEMFCCHAGYVQDGKKALHKKLDYLTSFQEEVIHLHDKGWNEKEIQHKMLPKKYPITYLSRGEWNSSHMIRSILTEEV